MTKSEPQEVADALRDELTLICQAQEAWKKAKGETRTPLLGELLEWLVVRTGLSDLLGVLETTDEENATLTRERDEALRQRDWYRERVVWTFTEEETPKYFQGLEGESEINAPTTALEITALREERDAARQRNSEDAAGLRDGLVKIHRERAEKAERELGEARAALAKAEPRHIEVDIGAALELLQSSPELAQALNEAALGKAAADELRAAHERAEAVESSLREHAAALVAMREALQFYALFDWQGKVAREALAAPLPALAAQIEAVVTAAMAWHEIDAEDIERQLHEAIETLAALSLTKSE